MKKVGGRDGEGKERPKAELTAYPAKGVKKPGAQAAASTRIWNVRAGIYGACYGQRKREKGKPELI